MKKSEDELAEVFYDEVMEQAGIEKYPPLKSKEEDEMEESKQLWDSQVGSLMQLLGS